MKHLIHFLRYPLSLLIVALCFSSCKKEEEFTKMIQYANESTLVINSISGLLETAFDVMSYNSNISNTNNTIVNEDGEVFFTDYNFFDGDGVSCRIYFGNNEFGSKGFDYRYKSGKMDVTMTSFYADKNNKMTIVMNEPDKLKVHHEYVFEKFKTYKVIGKIELKRVGGNKWFYETKNLRFSAISKDLKVELAGYLDIQDGRIEGFEDNYYTATYTGNINNEYEISCNQKEALTKDLGDECTGNYQSGKISIITKTGEIGILNFDPYNDASCDPYAKLSWSNKEELITLP